ncbi:hypothetical protein [Actinomadura sp. WMMA1423]|uniref:hypothetical protein n=1 Tax=Actinomadura sp. WMMA1423 TaxID=2591108 RepID=UPI0011468C7B|nr:hypothetical protein [Actinomadura sp. WMMA1423]
MATKDAVLVGVFTLSGVALQQVFTIVASAIGERRTDRREARKDRRQLFGREIAQARRIQRMLKESIHETNDALEERLVKELDALAEINAEIRLIASDDVLRVVLELEDEMRTRVKSNELRASGPLPLAPMIDALKKEIG